MPQQTKIFRVFVSSTFSDMKLERGILQRDAFPRLEKFCESKGAKFQAVDLRWGINEESSLNQKTLQICFNEISRCQKISPRPNFLILLGDKYGWQPIPETVPGPEMAAILEVLNEKDTEIIETWYKLDTNAIPFGSPDIHEYILQPKWKAIKEFRDSGPAEALDLKILRVAWDKVANQIREILRDAVKKLNFKPEQKIYYNASATHQEIIRGALNPPKEISSPEKHVFAFARSVNNIPNDKTADGFIDLLENKEPDNESKTKLDELKKELSGKLGDGHYKTYCGEWKNGTLYIPENDLKKFNDEVYDALEKVISDQIEDVADQHGITYEIKQNEHEIRLHGEFKSRLTEHFRGRNEILKTINEYLSDGEKRKLMSVIGTSGSGKSSVMAQAVKLNETSSKVIVYRFIGSTSRSTNIMSLLQSLCLQIGNQFGIEDPKTLGRDEKAWSDMNGLADIFRKCLELATTEKPLMLFIDSLDQLSDTDNAKALYWLPKELPDHVRIVVSSLPELENKLNLTTIVTIPPLPEKEAIEILDLWLRSAKRKLTDNQHNLVIQSFNITPLPIYLKLAFEKAKKWHSYDEEHSLKPDVQGIINEYFDDLEKEFPEDFVKTAICYMLSGRYMGLAENEILEILAFDPNYWQKFLDTSHKVHRDELENLKNELENTKEGSRGYMKIPIAVWSRLYLELEPFLTERDADGVPIITFFHRQFNEVLRERYKL
jgi:hypothetical protein